MKAKDAGRMVAIAVLLAVAAGACGGGPGDGGDQGGSDSQGQDRRSALIEILPTGPYDPGPNGGADLPEPEQRLRILIDECFAALRARSFDALALRMTAVIKSADPGTDRYLIVAARTCLGLAHLNDGALEAATRDLDRAEGDLGALPRDPKHQLELLLLRGQMVASAGQQRLDEAGAYLDRAAALAPSQAAQLERELAAASGASPTTTEPATTSPPTTTPATTGSTTSTTAPATSVTIG